MIATLIPFVVVSNITVDTPWKFGPEFVFQAEATVTLQNGSLPRDNYKMNSKLLCRPKEADLLSCRLEDFLLRPTNASDPTKKTFDLGQSNEPFEVKFVEQGVESIVVPRDMSVKRLNIVKAIVRQLTFGNAKDKNNCELDLQISDRPASLVMEPKAKNQIYKLELMPLYKPSNNVMEIKKKRTHESCQPEEPFVFDNVLLLDDPEKSAKVKLVENTENMESVIIVSDIGFRSCTKNDGTVSMQNENAGTSGETNAPIKISESIGLILTNIHPAAEELPSVPRPAKTSIKPNAELQAI